MDENVGPDARNLCGRSMCLVTSTFGKTLTQGSSLDKKLYYVFVNKKYVTYTNIKQILDFYNNFSGLTLKKEILKQNKNIFLRTFYNIIEFLY